MDFVTRDRYAHRVEEMPSAARCPKKRLARKAVELARTGAVGEMARPTHGNGVPRTAHVGHFL